VAALIVLLVLREECVCLEKGIGDFGDFGVIQVVGSFCS